MKIQAIKTEKIRFGEMNLVDFLDKNIIELAENTIVAITSKVVSLCERRAVKVGSIEKDELIAAEADLYLPRSANAHGFSMSIKNNILIPAAGIDESNTDDYYVLWPADVQKSANQAREFLANKFGLKNLGVIITDSKTTPLRWGTTGVGLAGSGFHALNNYIGELDLFGREMKVSKASILDGLAATAVMAMGEGIECTPLVIINDPILVFFQDSNPCEADLAALEIDLETDLYGGILSLAAWKKGGGGYVIEELDLEMENKDLEKYLSEEILSLYDESDAGHGRQHILDVLKMARRINDKLGGAKVESDLLTTAVICHDLGVIDGDRKDHNLKSGAMVRARREQFLNYFNGEEIEQIIIACEEHRASCQIKRSSLLSMVVADADTSDSINFARLILFNKGKYGDVSTDEILEKMLAHYMEKQHPTKGYAKYDLPEAEELIREQRDLLWSIMESEETFKKYMYENFGELLKA